MNSDGTRLIFWLDILVLLVGAILVALHQWDWVLALVIGLVMMNYFDRVARRRHRDE
jgi:hypothetical protein